MAQIKSLFEPVTEEKILALEERLKARLPPDYREFLLAHNGGSVEPDVFFISPAQGESSLTILFGITSTKAYDLWDNALDAYEDMDRTILPIGEDPGGNQVYLSLHPETYGQVLFRDHETPAPDCLFPVATSFTAFLQGLHELAD
jgi:cell wall assembly regulator SMI1